MVQAETQAREQHGLDDNTDLGFASLHSDNQCRAIDQHRSSDSCAGLISCGGGSNVGVFLKARSAVGNTP
jgi:hypothetical protein